MLTTKDTAEKKKEAGRGAEAFNDFVQDVFQVARFPDFY